MADLFLAFSPSLILGMMGVLLAILGGNDRQRILGLMTGGFLTSFIATPLLGATWTSQSFAIAHVSGFLPGWDLFGQTVCLYVLGVSRMIPTSIGLQLVSVSLGGVLPFGGWCRGTSSLFGAGTIVALTLGVWLASRHEKSESADGLSWPRDIRLLAIPTIRLVVYLLLVQRFGIGGRTVLLSQTPGHMTIALILTAPRLTPRGGLADARRSVCMLRQVILGMVWGCAVLTLQVSVDHVGAAAGSMLSQFGILISTPAGTLLPGESRIHKEMRWTIPGVTLVICGAALADFAKSLDPA